MAQDNLHEGHRGRLRAQFMQNGIDGFTPHQVLELLLFYTYPRIDTNEIAHKLINRFGSLAGVIDASPEELENAGVNYNTVVLLKMLPQCAKMYYSTRTEKISYDNPEKLKALFTACYLGVTNEQFRVACFDNDLRLICNVIVDEGSPSFSPVSLRKIAETVFAARSSYIVIAHNHPNGSPAPSSSDIFATRRIKSAMAELGVTLLDHIIVGANLSVSMRDSAVISIFD